VWDATIGQEADCHEEVGALAFGPVGKGPDVAAGRDACVWDEIRGRARAVGLERDQREHWDLVENTPQLKNNHAELLASAEKRCRPILLASPIC
jgi:hypothetical protein